MIIRRHVLLLAASALAAGAAPAFGAFGTANFAEALESGAPILVHVHATWCPTCRAQKPILMKLLAEPRFKAVRAFELDYDVEKDTMRKLAAPDRSTILVFKAGKEVARSVGDTSEKTIAALIEKGL